VVCQFSPHPTRSTLAEFISVPGIYAAGRLDWDSEGLLVLTDDGRLQHRIADPAHKLEKTYWVQVEGEPDDVAIKRLNSSVDLGDFVTRPAHAKRIAEPAGLWPRQPPIRFRAAIPTAWLSITISEGRNRQVRRMTAAVGHPTLRLIRARIGPWNLSDLPPGKLVEADPRSLPGR
jgi:23S rRNA pseudouridine2457 synthase